MGKRSSSNENNFGIISTGDGATNTVNLGTMYVYHGTSTPVDIVDYLHKVKLGYIEAFGRASNEGDAVHAAARKRGRHITGSLRGEYRKYDRLSAASIMNTRLASTLGLLQPALDDVGTRLLDVIERPLEQYRRDVAQIASQAERTPTSPPPFRQRTLGSFPPPEGMVRRNEGRYVADLEKLGEVLLTRFDISLDSYLDIFERRLAQAKFAVKQHCKHLSKIGASQAG